jgi:subtilase family serine protease
MTTTRRWLSVAALLALVAGTSAFAASRAAGADDPNNFTYQVNPLVQRVDTGSGPATFTNPYCSTRTVNNVTGPTLVCYGPADIKKAYDYPSSLDGTGQTIVIVDAFGSPTVQQDLAAFDAQFGIPAPPGGLQVVCPAGCPNTTINNAKQAVVLWNEETSLDVQWAHAMAPGAKLVLAVAPSPHGDAINSVEAKIFADPAFRGAIVSQSFGVPEFLVHNNNAQILQGIRNYQLARANGMTVLASAGDFGATNGSTIQNAGFPASDPDVLSIGGTQGNPYFNGRAEAAAQFNPLPTCAANTACTLGLATVKCTTTVTPGPTTASTAVCPTIGYGGEQTWNEDFVPGGAATGGAASLLFPAPDYQAGDGSGNAMRTIPDVSYNAAISGGVLVHLSFLPGLPPGGAFFIFGGTSAGSPQMSSVIALANQMRGHNLGFLNDKVYSIAEGASYSSDFHDITVGNNELLGTPSGNSAGTGYDLATGWGTPDVANFVATLASK